jgi:carboxypeptidase family protein/putative oligomerization/nucleic acid binding protein
MKSELVRVVARIAVTVATVVVAGCSLRITGVVRDEGTGSPIGGAVLSADDRRDRFTVTDPLGRFNIKTDANTTTMTVTAPSYEAASVAVPPGSRSRVVDVTLRSLASQAVATGPLVKPVRQPAADHGGDEAAGKLKHLQELYDRGVISNEEYQATRKRIIRGL